MIIKTLRCKDNQKFEDSAQQLLYDGYTILSTGCDYDEYQGIFLLSPSRRFDWLRKTLNTTLWILFSIWLLRSCSNPERHDIDSENRAIQAETWPLPPKQTFSIEEVTEGLKILSALANKYPPIQTPNQ